MNRDSNFSHPDYTISSHAGRGGEASVNIVRHNKFGYKCAIRYIDDINGSDDKRKRCERFIKECEKLRKIGNANHPSIVHISKPEIYQNQAFVEMDYIEGVDLRKYIQEVGYMNTDEILRLVEHIGSALDFCHYKCWDYLKDREEDHLQDDPNNGRKLIISEEKKKELIGKYSILHNDLHPGNIMRRDCDGRYILIDFGLSVLGEEINTGNVTITRRNAGIPQYVAPEKMEIGQIGKSSDIYSLGVILFECLTGQVPYPYHYEEGLPTHHADREILEAISKDNPPSIYDLRKRWYEETHPGKAYTKDYPDWLEDMVRCCLRNKSEDRYADGHVFYEDYKAHMAREPEQDVKNLKVHIKELEEANEQMSKYIAKMDYEKRGSNEPINHWGNVQNHHRTTQNKNYSIWMACFFILIGLCVAGYWVFDEYRHSSQNNNVTPSITELYIPSPEIIDTTEIHSLREDFAKTTQQYIQDKHLKDSLILGLKVQLDAKEAELAKLKQKISSLEQQNAKKSTVPKTPDYSATVRSQQTKIQNLQNEVAQLKKQLEKAINHQ